MYRFVISTPAFLLILATVVATAWSQTTADPLNGTNVTGGPGGAGTSGVDQTLNDRTANPTADLGTSNPLSGGTTDNPTLGTEPVLQSNQAANEGAIGTTDPSLSNPQPNASIDARNDWRMVMHNGHWWYWTPNNTWLYRRGDQWVAYVPRGGALNSGPQYSGSAAVDRTGRYQAGYRGTTQLEGDTTLRSGVGQSQLQTQVDPQTGLSTNANTPGFEATRPIAPTANELQGFYQQQGVRATPYGGTTGGTLNPTPLGGGATRSGTGAAGPANPVTPQTNVPGASPVTSSPGNPGTIGSPGNPSASGAAGTGTGSGGTTPAGGTGAAGASGTGASSGTGGTGS